MFIRLFLVIFNVIINNNVVKMQPLEQILGSKNRITLLRFLSHNRDWQFNLSEISKKIGLDKGALSRLIKEFEKKEIIELKRSGRLLLFRLNESNEVVVKSIIPLLEVNKNEQK